MSKELKTDGINVYETRIDNHVGLSTKTPLGIKRPQLAELTFRPRE